MRLRLGKIASIFLQMSACIQKLTLLLIPQLRPFTSLGYLFIQAAETCRRIHTVILHKASQKRVEYARLHGNHCGIHGALDPNPSG